MYVQSTTTTNERNTFRILKAGPYNVTSDYLFSEAIRNFQIVDNVCLMKKVEVKMELSFTHTRTSGVHFKLKLEENPILLYVLWQNTHLICVTHVDSYLRIEIPQSILLLHHLSTALALYSFNK